MKSCGETHARERNLRRARQDGGHSSFSNKRTLLFAPTTPPRRKMAFSSRHHKVSHGEDLRTRTPQGDGNQFTYCTLRIGRLLFKNQNPARGRKRLQRRLVPLLLRHLRTRTPQGDGAYLQPPLPERGSGQRHPITLRWRSCSWDVFPYDLLPNQLRPRACFLDRSAGGPRKRWRGRHGRKL